MPQIKITREQLEQDRFLEGTDTLLIWLKRNILFVLIFFGFGIVAYSAYGYWAASHRSTIEAANDAFASAQAKFQNALDTTSWGTPERTTAMQEAVAMAKAVAETYPNTPMAIPAKFLEGTAWFYAGDDLELARTDGPRNTEKAIEVFTKYVAGSKPGSFEYSKGSIALAYAYENAWFLTGQENYLTDAMGTFRQVADKPGEESGFLRFEALMGTARLSELAGNEEAAIEALRAVMKETHVPRANPDTIENVNRALVQRIRFREDAVTYAGLARSELTRLGVDVDTEFPLFKAEEAGNP